VTLEDLSAEVSLSSFSFNLLSSKPDVFFFRVVHRLCFALSLFFCEFLHAVQFRCQGFQYNFHGMALRPRCLLKLCGVHWQEQGACYLCKGKGSVKAYKALVVRKEDSRVAGADRTIMFGF